MFLTQAGLVIGQTYRALTHIKRFNQAARDPRRAQEEKLVKIIRANANTAFGKKHNFQNIRSLDDFRASVPMTDFETFRPYVDALKEGKTNQLTAEEPFMFASTSGTTQHPKFIPITETHLRDYTDAFQVMNYHYVKDAWKAAEGKFLIITSNDEEGRTESGIPYGAVSGLLNRRQAKLIRSHFATPYELCKIKDVDMKYYLMLRLALTQDVRAVLCCNPSSLLLLADQMKDNADELIADIFDGGVKSAYRPPAEIADAFAPYFKPQRERAQELERLKNEFGALTPRLAWSNFQTLSCWKGGSMSFYLERLPELYGNVPIRDFGYMASEGRGSIPIDSEGAGGVLAVTSHFFEFVPEHEMESPNPSFLTADELIAGQRYFILFTTSAGLYRYNINDLVEVTGFYENTPLIKFVRKGVGVSSVTGEKVTEEQILLALTTSVRYLHLQELSHFTAEVEMGLPPHYDCYAELNGSISEALKDEFIRIFDHCLKSVNPEYQDKRDSKRLGAPVLKILPPGTYARLRQQRVSEGAPEAQVKMPLLSSPNSFSGRLAALEVK